MSCYDFYKYVHPYKIIAFLRPRGSGN